MFRVHFGLFLTVPGLLVEGDLARQSGLTPRAHAVHTLSSSPVASSCWLPMVVALRITLPESSFAPWEEFLLLGLHVLCSSASLGKFLKDLSIQGLGTGMTAGGGVPLLSGVEVSGLGVQPASPRQRGGQGDHRPPSL